MNSIHRGTLLPLFLFVGLVPSIARADIGDALIPPVVLGDESAQRYRDALKRVSEGEIIDGVRRLQTLHEEIWGRNHMAYDPDRVGPREDWIVAVSLTEEIIAAIGDLPDAAKEFYRGEFSLSAETLLARGTPHEFELVLLVNGATGSMAELFAATLQASGTARLVGERTHGKSVGQRRHPVGGEGLLVLDAVQYFHPATGADWTSTGLEPDRRLAPGPPPESPPSLRSDDASAGDPGLRVALELLPATSRSGRLRRP